MYEMKANSRIAWLTTADPLPASGSGQMLDRQQTGAVIARRVIGGAFVLGLALLGLAFPVII